MAPFGFSSDVYFDPKRDRFLVIFRIVFVGHFLSDVERILGYFAEVFGELFVLWLKTVK